MRDSQATLHSGLNNCPCDDYNLGASRPVVLCSRDPVSSTNLISTAKFKRKQSSSKLIFWEFVAIVGWVMFLCAVAYNVAARRQVSFSTPSWLRFWTGGARGSYFGLFSLNGFTKLITNREQNELKVTAKARTTSELVPNASSSIENAGEGISAEDYVSQPIVQPRQKEPEMLHENSYESPDKYTRKRDNKVEHKDKGQTGSYCRLVEENDELKL